MENSLAENKAARAAGEAFQFSFPRCTWFGKRSLTVFACLIQIQRIEDVCIRFYFSIAMMKIKKKKTIK